jgi:hypothetical protein
VTQALEDPHTIEDAKSRIGALNVENAQLREQLEWFKRQLFGPKSEKRPPLSLEQIMLFAAGQRSEGPVPAITIPAHERRKHRTGEEVNDTGLRFGPEVPVRTIQLSCPELEGPQADQYEVIGIKESLRLARQPGSHVVLRFERPVVKRKEDGLMATVPAPVGVLDHAQVDVSFLAGMMVDKFAYHLPLYRQHQRLVDEGITVARSTLDLWMQRSIGLLTPVALAQQVAIVDDGQLKIDETPIKAGRTKTSTGQGKMKSGWLWPILGKHGDIAFVYSPTRGAEALQQILGPSWRGTLQTDGYHVYAQYAAKAPGCTHALCWAHTRRALLKAEASEPKLVKQGLEMIRGLYRIEERLREAAADATLILQIRRDESAPIVDRFFEWVTAQIQDPGLLPTSPLARALGYAREREAGLRVFLTDAWLHLDTNDLERALRVVPMGKKNWVFCSTEMGAQQVAVIQTLLATCRAHGIDAYTYLVDVLQRINTLPASEINDLTPRRWQRRFGADPLRSDLHRACQ